MYSSASRLIGLELSEDFVRLQNNMLQKHRLNDRVQVGVEHQTAESQLSSSSLFLDMLCSWCL